MKRPYSSFTNTGSQIVSGGLKYQASNLPPRNQNQLTELNQQGNPYLPQHYQNQKFQSNRYGNHHASNLNLHNINHPPQQKERCLSNKRICQKVNNERDRSNSKNKKKENQKTVHFDPHTLGHASSEQNNDQNFSKEENYPIFNLFLHCFKILGLNFPQNKQFEAHKYLMQLMSDNSSSRISIILFNLKNCLQKWISNENYNDQKQILYAVITQSFEIEELEMNINVYIFPIKLQSELKYWKTQANEFSQFFNFVIYEGFWSHLIYLRIKKGVVENLEFYSIIYESVLYKEFRKIAMRILQRKC